jgi:hypothetical protein
MEPKYFGACSSVVIKALCYELEFETRWGEWMFSIYLIFLPALGPEKENDCLDNVGSLAFDNSIGLHSLLQG